MIRVMARRKYLSDCKDACPGLLSLSFSDIDGSLVLVSCTTISVYVNLSKNMLSGRAHQRSATPSERRSSLICGCKGTLFPGTGKTFRDFFQKKMHFHIVYIIYYIRARAEGRGGELWHRSIRDRTGGEGSYGIAPYGTAGRGRGCALNFVSEAIIARMGTLFKGK